MSESGYHLSRFDAMPYPSRTPIQPVLAAGRSLKDFRPLLPAEHKLLDACRAGKTAVIADTRPSEATDDNTVRAAFIRFLALGGDHEAPVHEKGVQLRGAWIHGEFDLAATSVPHELWLADSHFDLVPILRGTILRGSLCLEGCELPGLTADRLECTGSIFMRNNFLATGEVRLLDVQIGGSLDCSNGSFNNKDGYALAFDNATIKGDVFLRNDFCAIGPIRLPGVKIGGNFECTGGTFNGTQQYALICNRAHIGGSASFGNGFKATGMVNLRIAEIDGNLYCENGSFVGNNGDALGCDGMSVKGAFFFRKLAHPVDGVSLNHARASQLVDDETSWGERLTLDGFWYGSIAGNAPTSAKVRLAWLDKQIEATRGVTESGNFKPQPWRQLQKVLHEMGHAEDARQVGIAFEER